MKYLSTRNKNLDLSFFEILFQGLSRDGGLFLPREWPTLDIDLLKNKNYEEVAFSVIHTLCNFKKYIRKSWMVHIIHTLSA